ncbi:hypothetical protein BLOT_012521 [Blomia tropicalis]|nr:hypothetical protein BLOT_012521 [Blomia tropicalis]
MFDIVHIDTVRGLIKYGSTKHSTAIDAFTRFVWAMTSKTTTGFNYVNLIQQVKQIGKQKLQEVKKLALIMARKKGTICPSTL